MDAPYYTGAPGARRGDGDPWKQLGRSDGRPVHYACLACGWRGEGSIARADHYVATGHVVVDARDPRVATGPLTFRVLAVQLVPDHSEEYRDYVADSLSEALTMAERDDAGRGSYTYGVLPEDYPQARAEGIAFNEADGLLLDDDSLANESEVPHD